MTTSTINQIPTDLEMLAASINTWLKRNESVSALGAILLAITDERYDEQDTVLRNITAYLNERLEYLAKDKFAGEAAVFGTIDAIVETVKSCNTLAEDIAKDLLLQDIVGMTDGSAVAAFMSQFPDDADVTLTD